MGLRRRSRVAPGAPPSRCRDHRAAHVGCGGCCDHPEGYLPRQCLTNIAAILEEAGSSLDKIVSVTVILADEDDFPGMNEEWLRWFPSDPPARQGAKLPAKIPGLKISIAAIAEA